MARGFLLADSFRRACTKGCSRISATDALAEAYHAMKDCSRHLAESLQLSIPEKKGPSAESDAHIEKVLRGLFEVFCYELQTGEQAQAAAAQGL